MTPHRSLPAADAPGLGLLPALLARADLVLE